MHEADDPQSAAEARVGTLLAGKYRLDRLLGVGGTAAVYAATHRNKKQVAVKVLHRELSRIRPIRERFQREGYVANSVGHRGAVRVDDDDIAEDGSAFLVMELLSGETAQARQARKGGRLSVGEVLAIAEQLLATLTAAHAQGIVHRDIKPENLFLTRKGVVKVLDFGIAHLRDAPDTHSDDAQTEPGTTLGTPAFMAPEQARGRWDEVDAQTDIWAAGATMFTLLTGELVHQGGTLNESVALAITARARPIANVAPELPPDVASIVDRALEYEKKRRWPSAIAMQAAVRAEMLPLASDPGAAARAAPSSAFASIPGAEGLADGGDEIEIVFDGEARLESHSATDLPPTGGQVTPQLATTRAVDESLPAFRSSRVPLVLGALATAAALVGAIAWLTQPEPGTAAAGGGSASPAADFDPAAPDEPGVVSVDDLPALRGGGAARRPTKGARGADSAPAPASAGPAPTAPPSGAPPPTREEPPPTSAPPATRPPTRGTRPNPYAR
ncbi:MAG: serine/threonine protein kinase [Polyangiaceae bacterium]|nr:serine/threonine protein kinase [Polyangiaceae bacterium]